MALSKLMIATLLLSRGGGQTGPKFLVVVLQAQVRDQLFILQIPQGVLQLD